MGKKSRTKGHSYERSVAKKLRHVFPKVERLLEYQESQANGIDLKNTGNYDIQCKRYKGYAPINKIFEVQGSGVPILVTKADRLPDMAVLPLDDLIRLIEQSEQYNSTLVGLPEQEHSV